jgi:anti-sigma-K factor RskA
MIDERREAQASLFVIGALPEDERREFETVMRGDLELQLLVKELQEAGSTMVGSFPRVGPPVGFKQRILAALDAHEAARTSLVSLEPDRPVSWIAWAPWALAACFALLCVALISIGQSLRQQAVTLNEELGERNTEAIDLRRQLDLLQTRLDRQATNYQDRLASAQTQAIQRIEEFKRHAAAVTNQLRRQQAETQQRLNTYRDAADRLTRENQILQDAFDGLVPGGTERLSIARLAIIRPTAGSAQGVIGASVWSPADQRGLLVLENLPALPPNQTYQLWLIDPKLPAPMSGGVLPTTASGGIRIEYSTQSRVGSIERFAISIEPRGGVVSPTGKFVLTSD